MDNSLIKKKALGYKVINLNGVILTIKGSMAEIIQKDGFRLIIRSTVGDLELTVKKYEKKEQYVLQFKNSMLEPIKVNGIKVEETRVNFTITPNGNVIRGTHVIENPNFIVYYERGRLKCMLAGKRTGRYINTELLSEIDEFEEYVVEQLQVSKEYPILIIGGILYNFNTGSEIVLSGVPTCMRVQATYKGGINLSSLYALVENGNSIMDITTGEIFAIVKKTKNSLDGNLDLVLVSVSSAKKLDGKASYVKTVELLWGKNNA